MKNLKKIVLFLTCFVLVWTSSQPAFAKVPKPVEHLAGNLRYTFGYWPVLILAGGAGLAGGLTTFDHSIANDLKNDQHFPTADKVAYYFAQPYTLDPIALALFGAGKLSHNEELAVTGETLLESLLLTQSMTLILKYGFDRTRPNGGSYSFPSGHAASMFAVATVLETLYGPLAGLPAYAAASFVGFSRMDMNQHYLSDVVFGAALGSAIGWGTAHFHKKKNPDLFVTPMVGKAQGIQVTWFFK